MGHETNRGKDQRDSKFVEQVWKRNRRYGSRDVEFSNAQVYSADARIEKEMGTLEGLAEERLDINGDENIWFRMNSVCSNRTAMRG